MRNSFISFVRLKHIDILSLIIGIYFTISAILNTSYLPTHFIFLLILLFFLPGMYFIRLLGINLKDIRSHFLQMAMIASLSLAINTVVSLFFLLLGVGPSIFPPIAVVLILLFATSVRSRSLPHDKTYEKPYKVNIRAFLPLAIVFAMSSWIFVYPTFLAPVPSPYPYHAAWDEFIYQGISNRIVSGQIIGLITDINPTTEELPLPLGFPVLVSFIFKTLNLSFHEAPWLLKIGRIIPAFIGSLWICAIAERKVGLIYSLGACFISLSFSGYNVLDIKFFLPSAFAWALSFGICYIFLYDEFSVRNRLVACLFLAITSLSFHLYTTVLIMVTFMTAYLLSRILKFLYKHKPSLTKIVLFYPLVLLLIILWMHVNGFQITFPGGGPANVDLSQCTMLMFRAISPFVWLVSLRGYLETLEYRHHAKPSSLFHVYMLTLLFYFLPISASFRVLYMAGVAASILTIEFIHRSLQSLKEQNLRFPTRMLSFFLSAMVIIACIYPAYVPFSRDPVYYIDTPEGKIATSYSLTEYRSAVFINRNMSDLALLIISDRGYSVILCGLTDKETLRARSAVMEQLQNILKSLQNKSFDVFIAIQLIEFLNDYYDVDSYDGILLAFSSRTHALLQATGDITFYAPLPPKHVDPVIRQNLENSDLLNHVYQDGDVDLFFLDLQLMRTLTPHASS